MSLKFRDASGVETPVAGLNGTSGELVPSVSYYQTGTYTGALPVGYSQNTVQLNEAMPDTNYVVTLSTGGAYGNLMLQVLSKTTSGFVFGALNENSGQLSSPEIKWQAFKLMTDESRALDEQAIAAIQAVIPSTATSSNKLVPANGVVRALRTSHWVDTNFNDAVPADVAFEVYTVLNSAANTPATGANYIVFTTVFSSGIIQQEAIQNGTNDHYVRHCNNGTWSAWVRLITSKGSIGYSTGLSGATYTTLSAFLTKLMEEVHAEVTTSQGVMPFGGVWSGKSLFTGVYYKQDSEGGSFQIEFQDPQDSKVFYHGYTVSGSVTYTAIA